MSVYDEIQAERAYQDKKWGWRDLDDTRNTPWMWVAYIALHSSRWMCGTFTPLGFSTVQDFRTAMVKTAAIAVAAIESIDRQRASDGKTFYE